MKSSTTTGRASSIATDSRRSSLGLTLPIKPPPSLARYGIDIEIDEKEWKRKNAPQIEVVGSFWNQISGHRVVLKARNGYICKPLYPRELWFYLSLQNNPRYRPFAPTLFGCVELTRDQLKALVGRDAAMSADDMEDDIRKKMERGEVASWSRYLESQLVGKLERESSGESKPGNASLLNYIVMEDITHGFRRPCVLDIKVGTRAYGDHADALKIQGQVNKVNATTSGSLGVRLMGVKVYQPNTRNYVQIDKYEGRRASKEQFVSHLETYFRSSTGALKTKVIAGFVERLQELLRAFTEEVVYRLYSTSLLFVYEGDEEVEEQEQKESLDGGKEGDSCGTRMELKMIDFAHTYLLENRDQDDGYVWGLTNLINILEDLPHKQPPQPSLS